MIILSAVGRKLRLLYEVKKVATALDFSWTGNKYYGYLYEDAEGGNPI